jgi:chloramphenicol 3-O-phosphotransferase
MSDMPTARQRGWVSDNERMIGSLVVLTGASGSGKTTLATTIQDRYPNECEVMFFDSVGVPSPEEMKEWGGQDPGATWQRATTLEWFAKLAPILRAGRSVLFEGQMRLAFIHEALEASEITAAHIVLVDCDDMTRAKRLTDERRDPALANKRMMKWAAYLRTEALQAGYRILDTGHATLDECVEHLQSYLHRPE